MKNTITLAVFTATLLTTLSVPALHGVAVWLVTAGVFVAACHAYQHKRWVVFGLLATMLVGAALSRIQ